MARSGIKVTHTANFDRWIRGMEHADREMAAHGTRAWEIATDVFFDRSQSNAHILSGENKASGSAEVVVDRDELRGIVTYDSDHAIYEEMRGGSHAFIGRAWEQTEEMFRRAMPEAWEAVVGSWR